MMLSKTLARSFSQRVAVIGAGPSGFYSAKYLLKEDPNVKVDILDALPSPYGALCAPAAWHPSPPTACLLVQALALGLALPRTPLPPCWLLTPSAPPLSLPTPGLVRCGVAPDHLEVKQVTNDFEEVASSPRFGYLGNVRVGKDVSVPELLGCYDALVLAYGAASDRDMGIPGEDLSGVCSARAFVSWYNGHPDFVNLRPNLDTEDVVIIGQGNVAIDCARILCKTPKELAGSDIAAHASAALAASRVKRVHVVGRRGHVQAAMTMKELREITRLEDAHFQLLPEELLAGRTPSSLQEIEAGRAKKRMDALLAEEAAKQQQQASSAAKSRTLSLRFLLSPTACLPAPGQPGALGALQLACNRLEGPAEAQRAVPTGASITLPTGLLLKSIGYKSLALAGVPFDSRSATIPNAQGRVLSAAGGSGSAVPGLYCAGWVKRGPTGIIGTNITDARETVGCMLEDMAAGKLGGGGGAKGGLPQLKALLASRGARAGQSVDWQGWLKVNGVEVERGAAAGKPREKVTSVAEMLAIGGH